MAWWAASSYMPSAASGDSSRKRLPSLAVSPKGLPALIQAVVSGGGGLLLQVLTWVPFWTPFAVLARLGGTRMIVGHTPQRGGITSDCGGKLWRIDVGLAAHYGGVIEVLEISAGGRASQ